MEFVRQKKLRVQFCSRGQENTFEMHRLKVGAVCSYYERQTDMSNGCKTASDV